MRSVALSELKAKISKYIRAVKAGEQVTILEYGVPVAVIDSVTTKKRPLSIAPRKRPFRFKDLNLKMKVRKEFDIVDLLIEDRRGR